MEGSRDGPLIDAEALGQLERLSLPRLDALLAGFIGQRVGPRGARGLEFADYRPYSPGDELRRIDWNIYARLGELFVKVAPSEAHIGLALLVDGSRSMDEGQPSKFRYAQQLAAMLGAVALLSSDAVQVHMLADGTSWSGATVTSPQLVMGLVGEVASLPRGERTDLARSIQACRRGGLETDLAVLITDALAPSEQLAEAVQELSRGARSSALVHVIDDRELATPLRGALELRDRETGERLTVDVTPELRERYRVGFELLVEQARELCAAHGVAYVRALTSVPALDLLFEAARRAEVVAL